MEMRSVATLLFFFFNTILFANGQINNGVAADGSRYNSIETAVPFLLIMPQARSAAMGNAGVALDGDATTSSLNTAALSFTGNNDYGFSVSYSPWLRRLIKDMDLSYLSGYYRLNQRSVLSASLRYFSLGEINLGDENFQDLGTYNPSELAVDIGYSRNLGPDFSLGGNIRYINSNFYSGTGGQSNTSGNGQAVAADVSGLYRTNVTLFATPTLFSLGISLSNIGTKMAYENEGRSYFLPANFKVGSAFKLGEGENKVTIALDFNKLMAPTQPIYDSQGNIIKGYDPRRSVPAGIFGSFGDAPGGFAEEIREVGVSAGLEFEFREKLFMRAGYNYQSRDKGNLSYLTTGLGFKYRRISVDFSYIASSAVNNPLGNTVRFGIGMNFPGNR